MQGGHESCNPGIRLFRQNNNKLKILHEILRRYKTSIE